MSAIKLTMVVIGRVDLADSHGGVRSLDAHKADLGAALPSSLALYMAQA